MMVERDEKKHLLVIKLFTTCHDLSKAIRILDNKKVFYKESKNIVEIGLLPELSLCNIICHIAFLVLFILNYRFYWLMSP